MATSTSSLVLILGLLGLCGAFDIQHYTGGSLSLYNATTVPTNLVSVIESEINGNWSRSYIVLSWADEAQTHELREAIYSALWEQLWQLKHLDNPSDILNLYDELSRRSDVPLKDQTRKWELHDNILSALWKNTQRNDTAKVLNLYYQLSGRNIPSSWWLLLNQTIIGRCALLFEAQLYSVNPNTTFPLLNLNLIPSNYLKDILQALFDAVLVLETPLSVAKRLENFSSNLNLLTQANLELYERASATGKADLLTLQALQSNLRSLLEKPGFERDVDGSLRGEVYARLSKEEQLLYTAQKVCIRNVTNGNLYMHECPRTLLMCNNDWRSVKAPFSVQRLLTNDSRPQFAFYSDYWKRYLSHDEHIPKPTNASAVKNIYSRVLFTWWRVVYGNGGISLLDAATEKSVMCAGDPSQTVGVERQVYSRNVTEFKKYQRECTWALEDCSYV
ncbi:uncharacterized protein [Drosophila kikkawai]|uniref:Uncharacterized protein n=1 Tax=Drosophila kikkawai TaxID=30033 RepID=A0A6P4I5G1_DROKI|nr:uncharacterized protein LOC108071571 [Drosophila kikkawai]